MHMVHNICCCPWLAVERQENQTPRIEARKQRCDNKQPECIAASDIMRCKCRFNNSIFREKACCTEDRSRNTDAGQSERSDNHHPIGSRNKLTQTTHFTHILFVGNCVNNRTSPKKEQCFEKCVSEQMENARAIGANTERHEHVTKLRTRRIGNDTLDIVLHQTDGRCKKCSCRTYNHNDCLSSRSEFENRRHTRNHENAGGNHRGGVNKRRNRCWPLHSIRQPCV